MARKSVKQSVFSLGCVHLCAAALPLMVVPHLARVLGPAGWGALASAEAVGRYLSLLVEYGFQLSATREVAQAGACRTSRRRIASGVGSAQVGLLAGGGILALLAGRLLPAAAPLIALALLWAAWQALSPSWYLQGVERMGVLACVEIPPRILAALAIIAFVRTPADAWLALSFQAAAAATTALVGWAFVVRDAGMPRFSLAAGVKVLSSSAPVFLFRGAVSLYTTANVVLLGLFAAPAIVAQFAGAEKIVRAAISLTGPVSQAFYPRISSLAPAGRREAGDALRASALSMLALGAVLGAVVFLCAGPLARIVLGPGYEGGARLLRVMAVLPPLVAASNVLGIQWMLPLRMDREFTAIVLAAGLLNVLLASLLGPGGQAAGTAASLVAAETAVTLGCAWTLSSRGLAPWRVAPV